MFRYLRRIIDWAMQADCEVWGCRMRPATVMRCTLVNVERGIIIGEPLTGSLCDRCRMEHDLRPTGARHDLTDDEAAESLMDEFRAAGATPGAELIIFIGWADSKS